MSKALKIMKSGWTETCPPVDEVFSATEFAEIIHGQPFDWMDGQGQWHYEGEAWWLVLENEGDHAIWVYETWEEAVKALAEC